MDGPVSDPWRVYYWGEVLPPRRTLILRRTYWPWQAGIKYLSASREGKAPSYEAARAAANAAMAAMRAESEECERRRKGRDVWTDEGRP
jgi:hypothetical protein